MFALIKFFFHAMDFCIHKPHTHLAFFTPKPLWRWQPMTIMYLPLLFSACFWMCLYFYYTLLD